MTRLNDKELSLRCRFAVVSCCGPKISSRPRKIMRICDNSLLVCQIQRVKIRPNTAYPRTNEVYRLTGLN